MNDVINYDWVAGQVGREKMAMALALRLFFPHITLELVLVLNSAVNLKFQLLYQINSSQHGDTQQK